MRSPSCISQSSTGRLTSPYFHWCEMPWLVRVDSEKCKEGEPMPLRKTLFIICLILSVLCLAAGYGIAGHWFGAMLAILTGPAWLLVRKYPRPQLPLVSLLIT